MLIAVFDPDLEGRLLVQRPKENSAHERLQDLRGYFVRVEARVDLAALLSGKDDLRDHCAAFFHATCDDFAHAGAGKEGGNEGAGKVGAAAGFFGGSQKKAVNDDADGLFLVGGSRQGLCDFGELNFGHDTEDMILGLEVVEEGSLAYVGGFRNLFDSNVLEAAFSEELEGAAEEADAGFRGAALAASEGLGASRG
jgi:hypothetical protein